MVSRKDRKNEKSALFSQGISKYQVYRIIYNTYQIYIWWYTYDYSLQKYIFGGLS